jgi:hypothetical protein
MAVVAATFEQKMSSGPTWALAEGREFFMERGTVQDALHRA